MKNVTLTLPEDMLAQLRVAAAREGKSMSKFLAELIEDRIGRARTQQDALEAFLAGHDLPGLAGEKLSREEIYAERLLHRHERDALPERLPGPGEAEDGAPMGRRSRRA